VTENREMNRGDLLHST